MAVKLRLMRMGKKKQPTYRVVAADSRSPRDGRFIEILGTYEPRAEPSRVSIDAEKAGRWLRHGAQPTDTVAKLLARAGVSAASPAAEGEPAAAAAGEPEAAAAPHEPAAAAVGEPEAAAAPHEPAAAAGEPEVGEPDAGEPAPAP
jgi:small subunit ribosomal protein S16